MNHATTKPQHVTLAIDGMSCGHCVQAVTRALSGLPTVRVRSVAVGSAEIEAMASGAAGDAIAAIEEAGYAAKVVPSAAAPGSPHAPNAGARCCGG